MRLLLPALKAAYRIKMSCSNVKQIISYLVFLIGMVLMATIFVISLTVDIYKISFGDTLQALF